MLLNTPRYVAALRACLVTSLVAIAGCGSDSSGSAAEGETVDASVIDTEVTDDAQADTTAEDALQDATQEVAEDAVTEVDEDATEEDTTAEDTTAEDATAEDTTAEDTTVDPENPLGERCLGNPDDFSFFVTSMDALWILAGSEPGDLNGGFGGDFGGLAGADEICQTIGDSTGFGARTWRAFLSATDDGSGSPVHAIERIGDGPWVDANGRTVATGIAGVLSDDRPDGDVRSTDDLPDECGVPLSALGDSHDVVTASDTDGRLANTDPAFTCNDWTSNDGSVGDAAGGRGNGVMCGHSFPRASGGGGPGGGGGGGSGGAHWISDHTVRGCTPGANLIQGPATGNCIGCSGGYGALYCFAL
jgi:hypothetical protein